MENKIDTEGVNSAFDLLLEQLQDTISQIHECVVRATEEGKYADVHRLVEQAEILARLKIQVKKLSVEFTEVFPQKPSPPMTTSEIVSLVLKKKNCHAKAKYDSGCVVVMSGSIISLMEYDSLSDPIKEIRKKLKRHGKLIQLESSLALELRADYRFYSPSAAAAFVLGYSANGKREWIVEGTGKSLGEI